MPTSYRQGDPRWASKIIGFGNKTHTFKNVGCTVCDITYLYNFVTGKDMRPDWVNDRLKEAKAFVGPAVYWSRVSIALPELRFVYRDHNYSNARVWAWINVWPRLPTLVEVYKSDSPTKRHWVTYIGGGRAYDPIKGQIISTMTAGYIPATGSARFSRS